MQMVQFSRWSQSFSLPVLWAKVIAYQPNERAEFSRVSYDGRVLQCLNSILRGKGRHNLSVVKFVRIFLYLHFNVNFSAFISAFIQNFSFALEPSQSGNHGVTFHYFAPVLQNHCVQNIQKCSPIVMIFVSVKHKWEG